MRKKLQPDRKFRLIHRYHQTGQTEIMDAFKDYPRTFELSFKYSIAHMYSIPESAVYQGGAAAYYGRSSDVADCPRRRYLQFPLGQSGICARLHSQHAGPDKVAGFYMGPDGYVWGREFIGKEPETPRELVISKRWYLLHAMGASELRSGPAGQPVPAHHRHAFSRRCRPTKCFAAWAEASKIFPEITRFFWGDIDVRWFPEGLPEPSRGAKGSTPSSTSSKGETMPGSGVLNIVEWRQRLLAGQPMDGVTPLEIAEALAKSAAATLRTVEELRQTPGIARNCGSRWAIWRRWRILGTTTLRRSGARRTWHCSTKSGNRSNAKSAIRQLFAALDHWKRYATAYTIQYKQAKLYNRVGCVDIPGLTGKVEQDIAIARLWTPGTIPDAARTRQADNPFRK